MTTDPQLRSPLRRFLISGFTAADVATALLSFDAEKPADDVAQTLREQDLEVAGVREDGALAGYAELDDLGGGGTLADACREFSEALVLEDETPLHLVVAALEDQPRVFISTLGIVGGIITREDLEKPVARMWMFGLVTIMEMACTRVIHKHYPGDAWREQVSPTRLEKAMALQAERQRVGRSSVPLLSCLYYADKAEIAFSHDLLATLLGLDSKSKIHKAVARSERLRNCLAHTHPILPDNWELLSSLAPHVDHLLGMLDD